MDEIVVLFRQRMIPLYLPSFCFNMKLAFHHLFSFEKFYPRIGVKFQIIQKKNYQKTMVPTTNYWFFFVNKRKSRK